MSRRCTLTPCFSQNSSSSSDLTGMRSRLFREGKEGILFVQFVIPFHNEPTLGKYPESSLASVVLRAVSKMEDEALGNFGKDGNALGMRFLTTRPMAPVKLLT
eukprot:981865-Rhodomonas_salina.3